VRRVGWRDEALVSEDRPIRRHFGASVGDFARRVAQRYAGAG
jgi:hypothetical protein